jgi:hypothetical protein
VKFIKRTKFWWLPLSLKLVVLWLFLTALNNFLRFGSLLIFRFSLDILPLIGGTIEWSLAAGLVNRNNESRKWSVLFVFLGSLFWLLLLMIAIFKDPNSVEGLNVNYERFSRTQMIGFLAGYFILDGVILLALLSPKTKKFFSEEPDLYIQDKIKEDVNINHDNS